MRLSWSFLSKCESVKIRLSSCMLLSVRYVLQCLAIQPFFDFHQAPCWKFLRLLISNKKLITHSALDSELVKVFFKKCEKMRARSRLVRTISAVDCCPASRWEWDFIWAWRHAGGAGSCNLGDHSHCNVEGHRWVWPDSLEGNTQPLFVIHS